VYIDPQPTLAELEPFYSAEYHVFNDEVKSDESIAALVRDRFDGERLNHAAFVRGGKFLDVGCGLGDMVAAMRTAGMDATGVDPSPIAVGIGQRCGRDLRCGTLAEQGFSEESFDSISMIHSLEHNQDPVATLVEAARILKRDGVLMVAVPNFRALAHERFGDQWTHLDPPVHLHQFSTSSLEWAGKRAGLNLGQMQTESFVDHMEAEYAKWARRRLFIPQRISLRTRLFRRAAQNLFKRAVATNRGDAMIAHFGRA
jgi:SAM-dependent methyltransferase